MSFRQKIRTAFYFFKDFSLIPADYINHAKFCAPVLTLSFSLFALVFLGATGCSRQHYRAKTDREAYNLLECATRDPRWKIDDYRIDVDPRSRMFDSHDPDKEPMPPDDPAAHRKMHRVAGKKVTKHGKNCTCTACVENPNWKQFLLFNDRGAVALDKDGAFELALLHSPEYQTALENTYLSALDVSQERFRFDVQFYGGDSLFYTAAGRLKGANGSTLVNDIDVGATKRLATGGELAVSLANSITWTFAGPDQWKAESLLKMNLTQPLLRGAGRKIVLENLTKTERDFLAKIRQMVYFQQGYYVKIVTGRNATDAPSGGVSSNTPSLGSGFYGLLADQIQIQNQRQNIIGLEDNLDRFIEIFQAGQLTDAYQVEETRQNLLTSESALLERIKAYQASVDIYLQSLGLPPDLDVEIADPLMEEFQLTSPSLTKLQEDLGDLLAVVRKRDEPFPVDFDRRLEEIMRQTRSEIKGLENDFAVLEKSIPKREEGLRNLQMHLEPQIRAGERIDSMIYDVEHFKKRIALLRDVDVPKNIRRLESAFVLIDMILRNDEPTIRNVVDDETYGDEILDAMILLRLMDIPDPQLEDALIRNLQDREKTDEILADIRGLVKERLGRRVIPSPEEEKRFEEDISEDRLEKRKVIEELKAEDIYRDWIRRVLSAFQYELSSLSIMQTRARLDAITLVPTSISPEDAFEIASENRLDWMNRKAALVDVWRQIDIAADQLKSDLDIIVDGELGTVDKRGVRFDGDAGRLSVGVQWKSPLNRHDEMLGYRRAQIAYQAARRNYYSYVDSVKAELRSILRDIQLNQVEFEIKRNAILIATTRVDLMQLRMDQPPVRGGNIETNTADQLIRALDGLLASQNAFLNTWVQYQTQRMLLDLKMGTMELDSKGRWVDPGTITKDRDRTFSSQEGPYAGAFARETSLTPSHRKTHHSKRRMSTRKETFPEFVENEMNVEMNEGEMDESEVNDAENPGQPKKNGANLLPGVESVPMLAPPRLELETPEPEPETAVEPTSEPASEPKHEPQSEPEAEPEKKNEKLELIPNAEDQPPLIPRMPLSKSPVSKPENPHPKTSRDRTPRSSKSGETVSQAGRPTGKSLKNQDAPPPPKTPE